MQGPLRISRLRFEAASESGAHVDLDPGRVLVLVGPNNAGKSLALREIEHWSAGTNETRHVIAEIDAEFPLRVKDAMELLSPLETPPPENQALEPEMRWFHASALSAGAGAGRSTGAYNIRIPSLEAWLRQPTVHSEQLRSSLLRPLTARLDGHTRFELSNDQPCGDLQRPSENHLGALFRSEPLRSTVRRLTAEAFPFGPRYFVIEYVGTGQLRVRLSPREPVDEEEEQGLTQRARDFHAASVLLAEQGDGVRAFTGLVAALVSLPQRTMLVDEPEAFLHPTLARRLGNNLASLASQRETTLLAASHSPEFLMGCLDAGAPVTVVRLTYDPGKDVGTARYLPASELRSLMTDPLLRSTGALDGLFHRAVVVGEADADRAFYDEINHRLSTHGRGAADCLFSNAQNWQTIERIIGPLRRLGIPAAAIIDLDAIAVSGPEWGRILDVLRIDARTRAALESSLSRSRQHLRALGAHKPFKTQGLAALAGQARDDVESFLIAMATLGIFIVPVGELEQWLRGLGARGPKSKWIVDVFQRLGDDPSSPAYVGPTNGDVWDFVEAIAAWIDDPSRAGVG